MIKRSNVPKPLKIGRRDLATLKQLLRTACDIADINDTQPYRILAHQGDRVPGSDNTQNVALLDLDPTDSP